MTHFPIDIPLRGFTEQTPYSTVPKGFTPSCMNVMPVDVFSGRIRLSVRNGSTAWDTGGVQFLSSFRAFIAGTMVERLILVRAGKVYWAEPHSTNAPSVYVNQSSALLNTTGFVEGVQFNEYFYFVDGDHYVKVLLTDIVGGASAWGTAGPPQTGPYKVDPTGTVSAGERAKLICRFGARLVLSGFKRTPAVWFSSEIDEPDNWGTGDTILADNSSAIAGSVGFEYGTLGDPIVAIFPFAESGLMFACTNSLAFLTKDPVFDGSASMVSLTKSIGISGQRAWCMAQEKGAYLLAKDGLYYINPSDFNLNRANRISAGRLDSFFARLDFGAPALGGNSPLAGGTMRLLNTADGGGSGAPAAILSGTGSISDEPTTTPITQPSVGASLISNTENGEVFPSLVWDPDREGVWVFLSVSGAEASSVHLYYDTKTDSFWLQRFYDPLMYAPSSSVYIYPSRTTSGKLFMGSGEAIATIDRAFPIGIDGYDVSMTDEEQTAQLVRSSVTLGPILAPLPYRVMLNEVRVDMGEDEYELPSNFTDLSDGPYVTASTGDTAQAALGLQTDALFIVNINELVVDGGTSAVPTSPTIYDGGTSAAPSPSKVDGRYAAPPWGRYQLIDPFSTGIARVYAGPENWVLWWDVAEAVAPAWVVARDDGTNYIAEYRQNSPDTGSPNSGYVVLSTIQTPVAPDIRDNAVVSGAAFASATVTELAQLNIGRNEAIRCRIRSEAIYLTLQSDGRPWSMERISAIVSQVGKSRGGS